MTTFADKKGFIWMDGKWLNWQDAKIHVLTHTLHYGMGAFEGVRAYKTGRGTEVFRLQDHTDRWFHSAHILGMKMPFDKKTLNRVQCEIIVKNDLSSAYLRPMCFYGSEGMGLRADNLKVHVMVAAWEWGSYLGEDNLRKGIRVRTASFVRHHANAMMTKAKANGNYINSMMALQEALTDGYDEALMLDTEGFVAEGSGENIFIVREKTLLTPELSAALGGITRATILKIAEDMGIKIVEKRITRDEVYAADEAFFTGTAAEVMPIKTLDNRTIGNGKPGPMTQKLQARYFDCVYGRDENYAKWRTLAR